jgi:hypothetical protein
MDRTYESDGRSHCAIVLPDEPRLLGVHTLVVVIVALRPSLAKTLCKKKKCAWHEESCVIKSGWALFNNSCMVGRMSVSHHVLNFVFRSRRLAKESGLVADANVVPFPGHSAGPPPDGDVIGAQTPLRRATPRRRGTKGKSASTTQLPAG